MAPIQSEAILVRKETIGPAWWQLVIHLPELTSDWVPGQFFLLRGPDPFSCYLRRPIFPQPLDNNHLSLLLPPQSDPALAWLLARSVGDRLDLIGPLGQGFELPAGVRNLLLVSDSQLISPLLALADRAVAAGLGVTLAVESSRAATLYPAAALSPVVEYQVATRDGSLGHHGSITELLPDLLAWADLACAVGSTALYRSLKQQVKAIRFGGQSGFSYGLLSHLPMACGVGACFGCARGTEAGLRLICVDGPVFDLTGLDLTGAAHD